MWYHFHLKVGIDMASHLLKVLSIGPSNLAPVHYTSVGRVDGYLTLQEEEEEEEEVGKEEEEEGEEEEEEEEVE